MKIKCKNEHETKKLANQIAKQLKTGDILCLDGDLGAGKTTFSKYLCKALGYEGYVNSPSYSIVNEYSGEIKINHFDVYRLYSEEELYDIGFEEYLHEDAITIIEWAVKIENMIPEDSVWINIKLGCDINQRVFIINGLENLDV